MTVTGGATSNTIGGTSTGAGNVISRNLGDGVAIDGSNTNSNTVVGNWIGTDENSSADIGNDGDGVSISDQAQSNTIGGAGTGAGNVIAGNNVNGVSIDGINTKSNTVSGNWIGTDENNSAEIGNGGDGVSITGQAQSNTIGGTSTCAGNVISNNDGNGVTIDGNQTNSNTVAGNWIGTAEDSTAEIGNRGDGVSISGNAQSNTIGGTATGSGNVISANLGDGVGIDGLLTKLNTVVGNWIGTDDQGSTDLGNIKDGVLISGGAQSNWIGVNGQGGAACAAERNVIGCNWGVGVRITGSSTTGNAVAGNYIGVWTDGTTSLANHGDGVRIEDDASGNRIGSDCDGVCDRSGGQHDRLQRRRGGLRGIGFREFHLRELHSRKHRPGDRPRAGRSDHEQ